MDIHVYHPISTWLVEPCHRAGLTPNAVTTMSKTFGAAAIIALLLEQNGVAALLYIASYILDCVDGKLARRYKQCSLFGMLYDFDTDIIQHVLLYAVMIACNGGHLLYILHLYVLVALNSVYYGLVLALQSVARHKHDDFFTTLGTEVTAALTMTGPLKLMAQFFMLIHKSLYCTYKLVFPKFDVKGAANAMAVLRHFGPGTLVTITALDMYLGIGNMYPSLATIGTLMNGVGSTKLLVASVGVGAAAAYSFNISAETMALAIVVGQTVLAFAVGAEASLALACGAYILGFLLCSRYA